MQGDSMLKVFLVETSVYFKGIVIFFGIYVIVICHLCIFFFKFRIAWNYALGSNTFLTSNPGGVRHMTFCKSGLAVTNSIHSVPLILCCSFDCLRFRRTFWGFGGMSWKKVSITGFWSWKTSIESTETWARTNMLFVGRISQNHHRKVYYNMIDWIAVKCAVLVQYYYHWTIPGVWN